MAEAPAGGPAPVRVLLVEDNEDDALLVLFALSRGGYEPEARRVETAEALRAALAESSWDLVIADWWLPRLNALSALALVREYDPDVPFVIVSGVIGEDDAVAAMRAGAQDYLMKDNLTRLAPAVDRELREAQGRRRRRAAEAATARLVAAVEQADEAIFITDTDGIVEYVNPAFERSSGYARQEVVGLTPAVLRSGRHEPGFFVTMWAALHRGENWSGHLFNRRKDGSLYEVDATISPVRDPNGKVTNYVAVQHDVTALVTLQEQLTQAQKMEAVGRLAGGIAHDFNNLLVLLLNHAEFLAASLPADDPRQEDISTILAASQRAAALTGQLLTFSRREPAQPRVVDLNTVVVDVRKLLRLVLGEDVELEHHLGEGLPPVMIDPGRLDQVLMNLAVNARDAMPGGGRLSLTTGKEQVTASEGSPLAPGEYVTLTVEDTGCGMDAAVRGRVFEPYFTTKERGKGTGLGLSTVYGIVTQANGWIRVESEPGAGTTFTILLPAQASAAAERPTEAEATPRTSSDATVLVVEDEPLVRALVRRILERQGYQVFEAASGADALAFEAAHEGPVNLLLSDVVMPQMSGPELAERFIARRPDTRVLFMSGYTDDVLEYHHVWSHGAILAKPFTGPVLLDRVAGLLR